MTPLVSILCLSYNQSQFIVESLESIKAQTYTNFEILICDDYSKDDSVKKISDWITNNSNYTINFIQHDKNKGICKSLNELLALAKGKYIQMLALDDILLPNKLENHVEILEQSTEQQVMLFTDSWIINENSVKYQNTFIPFHYNFLEMKTGNFYERLSNDNFIPAMSCLVKTQALRDIGGWDENLSFEDYDMWLRLSREYDFIYVEEKSCQYRLHSNNTHKKRNLLDFSLFDIYSKHPENPKLLKKTLSIIDQQFENAKLEKKHIDFINTHCYNVLKYKLMAKGYKRNTINNILYVRKKVYQYFKI